MLDVGLFDKPEKIEVLVIRKEATQKAVAIRSDWQMALWRQSADARSSTQITDGWMKVAFMRKPIMHTAGRSTMHQCKKH